LLIDEKLSSAFSVFSSPPRIDRRYQLSRANEALRGQVNTRLTGAELCLAELWIFVRLSATDAGSAQTLSLPYLTRLYTWDTVITDGGTSCACVFI
jgi:hypothetical protein